MAKIVLSDTAPNEAKSFSLANANFDVPYDTTDPVVIANALAHPWLDVEFPKPFEVEGQFREPSVRPEDDALSSFNSVANDPAAVKAHFESLAEEVDTTPLAVDAGLDQDKPVTVGEGENEVAVTLAADDDADSAPTKRSSRSTTTKKDND